MNKIILSAILMIIIAGSAAWFFYKPAYRIESGPPIEREMQDFSALDDISDGDIERIIPPSRQGSVEIVEMRSSKYFDYMAMNSLMSLHSALQGRENPVSLEVKSGVYRLGELEDGENIVHTDKGWFVRVPVIVHPAAALVIESEEDVLLEEGSFISSFGKLFVWNSTLQSVSEDGWHRKKFRPYIVVWSGGEGYLGGSRFKDLGYNHAKSYGITFSSSAIMEREEGEQPAPRGMLIGNHFEGLYYGFYSYEAEKVVIARNIYKDNIVYGIDPHDFSRDLTIANNRVFGTKEKHGIILSRGVTDSVIYGNKSYRNKGSGIMLERNSSGNVIVENVIEKNEGDGLVFLESSNNRSQGNIMSSNVRSGIRIRNSHDLDFYGDESSKNGDYGLIAYSRALIDQEDRDLSKDSYGRDADFAMQKGRMLDNKKAAMNVKDARQVSLSDTLMLKSPKMIVGDLDPYSTDILGGGNIILTRKKSYADFLLMR